MRYSHLMKEESMAQEVSVGTKLKSKQKFCSALWYRGHPTHCTLALQQETNPSLAWPLLLGLDHPTCTMFSSIRRLSSSQTIQGRVTKGEIRWHFQVLPTVRDVNVSLAPAKSHEQTGETSTSLYLVLQSQGPYLPICLCDVTGSLNFWGWNCPENTSTHPKEKTKPTASSKEFPVEGSFCKSPWGSCHMKLTEFPWSQKLA